MPRLLSLTVDTVLICAYNEVTTETAHWTSGVGIGMASLDENK